MGLLFQVSILLFQRGILLFQSQTFHSKSKSISESPGVPNRKGCFGSPNLALLRFTSEENLGKWRFHWTLMTFHSQVTSLLFQRGILLFESQTFHSKSNSMSESPGVSN